MHDPPLISLISLIATGLVLALVGGLMAVRLRLSPIVCYLLANAQPSIVMNPFVFRMAAGKRGFLPATAL